MSGVVVRPGVFCRELLESLDASEGRRRRRKRDTTPDAIGLAMKKQLLEGAAAADPAPEDFEGWLLERCLQEGAGGGGLHALALSILEEWRFAAEADHFREWLERGAPSDDVERAPRDPSGPGPGERHLLESHAREGRPDS